MNTSKINWYSFFVYRKVIPVMLAMIGTLLFASVIGGFLPFLIADLSNHYNSELYFNVVFKLLILFLITYFNRYLYQILVHVYIRDF